MFLFQGLPIVCLEFLALKAALSPSHQVLNLPRIKIVKLLAPQGDNFQLLQVIPKPQ